MKTAIISNSDGHVYIKREFLSKEEIGRERDHFSQIIPKCEGKFQAKSISVWEEVDKYVKLPRAYGIKYAADRNIVVNSKLITPTISNPIECKIKLYDYQEEAVATFNSSYDRGEFGGIWKIGCGGGKTPSSLVAAARRGKKTLIIVNGDTNCDRWRNEMAELMPDLEIPILSRISGKNVKARRMTAIRDSQFIITCHMTLVRSGNFEAADFNDIDLVIMDEVHEYISEVTLGLFKLISRRYILGLSATPTKPNGLEFLLNYYIGPVIYEFEKSYMGVLPIVYRRDFDVKHLTLSKDMTYLEVQKTILSCPLRRGLICDEAISQYRAGKKILVIGLLREQLEQYKSAIEEIIPNSCALYYSVTGKKAKEERNQALIDRPIILAIRQMGAQSVNIVELNCMILASKYIPKNGGENTEKIEQMVGRLFRKKHEISPIIVDIVDGHFFFLRHAKLCRDYFLKCGYKYVYGVEVVKDIEEVSPIYIESVIIDDEYL